jgi:hypothetical protein
MRGQYSTHRGLRPCRAAPDSTAARFFLCGRCRTQVLVCRWCDRGQIYCADSCAQDARRQAQREASQRYQTSRRGRLTHAARNRRYRARQKNVTHQGSLLQLRDDVVPPDSAVTASESHSPSVPSRPAWHCHWCGCRCSEFVRQGFLRCRRVPRTITRHDRKGPHCGHPP